MIDIDFFKNFNDIHGHLAGDDCLRRVAAVLVETLHRPADLPARWGGEEFACILPNTDAFSARAVAERLRVAVAALPLHPGASGQEARVTISLGVASLTPAGGQTPDILIQAADERLFEAKSAGRNRVAG